MATNSGKPTLLLRNLALACVISHTAAAWAGGSACVDGTGVRACVTWSLQVNPVPNQNFRITFDATGEPNIELRTGDAGWEVYAVEVVDGQATNTVVNIASLTIDPSSPSQSFTVSIKKGSGPGAANVGTVNLDAASWTGHSSIGTGSHITGDLTGPLTIKSDGNGDGGELWLIVNGDVTSPSAISVPIVKYLRVSGDIAGDLDVTAQLDGILEFYGNVGADSVIVVEDFGEGATLIGNDKNYTFSGRLELPNGVPADAGGVAIGQDIAGTIDLMDADIHATLNCFSVTSTGRIINGGIIRSPATVGIGDTGHTTATLAGEATFAGVESGANVFFECSHLDGTLTIASDVAGNVLFGSAGIGASGVVLVGGDVTATGKNLVGSRRSLSG
ncbi:hypothetical protein RAS1_35410 [Phycisphaerae bacterium RAS1]|nr:hypothetical protein RAS1_35410 [Phycisphaerae bacterium RAS1]